MEQKAEKTCFEENDNCLENWVIEMRRHFHRYPELSYRERETQQKIMTVLEDLEIEFKPIADTGIIATIYGANAGKTIAIRTDMDALKIKETSTALNAEYLSLNDGVMHACGHDGHMAMVLGAARLLKENREKLNGNVRLIFQPAEEIPPGGSIRVIEEGGLDGVDAIIGMHLFTNFKSGEILINKGVMMAGNCCYNLEIFGKSGHHADPEFTIDPTQIAAEFILNIHSAIKQLIAEDDFVFGVGTINGGKQFNQVPDSVSLSGSFRAFSAAHMKLIEQQIRETMDALLTKYKTQQGVLPSYKFSITEGYPALINHVGFAQRVTDLLINQKDNVAEIAPVFASEDFARYLNERPGAYIFLGAGNAEKSITYYNHSSSFDIDEDVLIKGASMFYMLTKDYLDNSIKYLTK